MAGSYRIECSNHRCRDSPFIRADGFKAHLILRPLCTTGGSIFPSFFDGLEEMAGTKNPAEMGAPPGDQIREVILE
jgi:hypothetical protein